MTTKGLVAVVGAGSIGKAWALVFAQAGHDVSLWDPDLAILSGAPDLIRAQLDDLAAHELLSDAPDTMLQRIGLADSLEQAVGRAVHVQENGPEDLALRRTLFAALDRHAPATATLASSTSGMPPSSFTDGLAGRARCLVAHAGNPPYLLPLVELCPAPWTSAAALDGVRTLMQGAGRQVATMHKEAEGFILNRLQGALLAEAFRLVADGIADPAAIDTVMKGGLGLRWSFMGPFETVDLNAPGGVADFFQRYGSLYERLQEQMPPLAWDADLVGRVAAERRSELPLDGIAARQAWRDRRLMALAQHMAGQPPPG
ncbi:MAG: 3-hydroxyacyl-CoA dehydrogenase [Janthinobacterium lividum]